MSPVTFLALPVFSAMLVKTAFMLKPLEARKVANGTDNTHLHGHRDLWTEQAQGPRGRFSENVDTYKELYIP